MYAVGYVWSLLVTWQRWQSRHSICYSQKPLLHATCRPRGFVFYNNRVMGNQSFALQKQKFFFTFLASVALTSTRWPLRTNLTHIPWRHTRCAKMNVLHQGFQKLSSDRHADRQTSCVVTSGHALSVTQFELWAIEVYIAEIGIFDLFFAPVTLTLTWWPSYTNLTSIPWRYTGYASMNFLRQDFRKLSWDRRTNIWLLSSVDPDRKTD